MKNNIPYWAAKHLGDRFIDRIKEFCYRVEYVGQIRRRDQYVDSISILVVPDYTEVGEDMFGEEQYSEEIHEYFKPGYKGMIKNGRKFKQFTYDVKFNVKSDMRIIRRNVIINLFITDLVDYGRVKAIRTGSERFVRLNFIFRWSRMGYVATEDGLFKKDHCVKVSSGRYKKRADIKVDPITFETEKEFFRFLGIDYVAPHERSWQNVESKKERYIDEKTLFDA